MIKNEMLDTVDTTLFLGLTLDSQLRWNSHITRLAKRLGSAAHANLEKEICIIRKDDKSSGFAGGAPERDGGEVGGAGNQCAGEFKA
ncbi:hypothetical protein EVAR_40797_1 [Eumeta japonica]|uniref:Uncharacterized protein n=1 Tax=Eumeta variegata TaxID=151549 RepID=A0A4C1X2I4_EUMVA|nr:hypothetical protein EVAR_40797_1 [Eumeta japonica]